MADVEGLNGQGGVDVDEGLTSNDQEQDQVRGPEAFDGSHFYAWGRLGRLLMGDDFKEAFESTPADSSFVYLDGCSSTPWLREVMRAQITRHVYLRQANAVINRFETDFKRRDPKLNWRLVKMRQEHQNEARSYISEKELPRQILQAAVFELLSDPEHVGIKTQREERLSEYFLERFQAFPSRYLVDAPEQEQKGDAAGWRSLYVDEAPVSLVDIFGSGSLTPEEVEVLIRSMAESFAHQLAGQFQPAAKFLSLDIGDVNLFRRFAYRNFPRNALTTRFFRNVLDPERHIVGDIRDLSMFEEGSVSVYSMIEGFPFYIEQFSPEEGAAQVVSEAARVLRAGGKLILFPWLASDGRDLTPYEAQLGELGFQVDVKEKDKEELLSGMSPRELGLVTRSPIFTDTGDSLPLLVATKMAA